MRPTVFLDRDDTLIRNSDLPPVPGQKPGDLVDPDLIKPLPGAVEACAKLASAGFTLVVITNQGAIARGGGTLDDLEACNDRLNELFGNRFEAIYACPLHPKGNVEYFTTEHDWRKPNPGMITAAMSELELDPAASWLVGDADRDAEAGVAAGLTPDRCLLVGKDQPFADLPAAAEHIIKGSQ